MSIVLKAKSDSGMVYFKTVNEAAHFEAPLTSFIATVFPGITAELLAIDIEKNWKLMLELPGQSLRETRTMEAYSSFIISYADFQQQTFR